MNCGERRISFGNLLLNCGELSKCIDIDRDLSTVLSTLWLGSNHDNSNLVTIHTGQSVVIRHGVIPITASCYFPSVFTSVTTMINLGALQDQQD